MKKYEAIVKIMGWNYLPSLTEKQINMLQRGMMLTAIEESIKNNN